MTVIPELEAIEARVNAAAPIPMAPGYAATEDGRIISFASNWRGYGERELITTLNQHGYPSVRVMIDGKRKHISVHRLVANTFLPTRPSPNHEIRHLDGDKLNRHKDNLAWGTQKDNAADRQRHGRTASGERNGFAVLTDAERVAISKDGRRALDIAPEYGVHPATINKVKRRLRRLATSC